MSSCNKKINWKLYSLWEEVKSLRIIVNGKDREGTWKTAYEVPAVSPKGEFIRILNGFQIEKDIPLKEGDVYKRQPWIRTKPQMTLRKL